MAALGAAAIGWALFTAREFWEDAAIVQVSEHILSGDAYKRNVLDGIAAVLDDDSSIHRPSVLSKAVVIRLRRAEEAIGAGEVEVIDSRLDALSDATNLALARAPDDSFLWLVLFWLDNSRRGFAPGNLRYLRDSYALGPNEGWVAVRRSRLALSIFPVLPSDLAEASLSEFSHLVRSQQFNPVADIVAALPPATRAVAVSRLADVDESDRRILAKLLYDRNLDDIPIPGVDSRPSRPWR